MDSMIYVKTQLAACIAASVLLVCTHVVHAQAAAQKLPSVRLSYGMLAINAEVARTPTQRQIGLMHRPSLPANDGMLFVFDEPATQCFWMRNTLVALSIAYLADDGTVVNIADMQPQSDKSHCSTKPVKYALEMNQGWFAKRGIKPGSKIGGVPPKP
jgi:uncharacterized protein